MADILTNNRHSISQGPSMPIYSISNTKIENIIIHWEDTLLPTTMIQRVSWKQAIAWYNNNFQAHLNETDYHDAFHTKYFPNEGALSSFEKVEYLFGILELDLETVPVFLNVYRNYYKKYRDSF